MSDLRGRVARLLPRIVLGGAGVAALLIAAAPTVPRWGVHHTPHLDKPSLRLNPGQTVEQTFRLEEDRLDTLLLWIDRGQPVPQTGALAIVVRVQKDRRSVTVPFTDVLPSGTIVVPLTPVLRGSGGTMGSINVSLVGTSTPVFLSYQIGETIYPDGDLRHSTRRTAKGDLAFRVRYADAPFGHRGYAFGIAAATLAAGAITAWALRCPRAAPAPPWTGPHAAEAPRGKRDLRIAALLGLAVAVFYAIFLLRPGMWIGPDDFTKDVTYLTEGAAALRAGAWPEWAHARCGGLPLVGNPESNILGLGTLFATILPADRALELLLALEAGMGAAGVFFLARVLGLPSQGAAAAALTMGLAGTYAYRLAEGWAMLGGAVAFLPWAAAFLGAGFQTRDRRWAAASGLALAASFYRGDLHLVVGVFLLCILWAFVTVIGGRRLPTGQAGRWPFEVLLITGVAFAFFSLPKVLGYLEGPSIVPPSLPSYTATLIRDGIVGDVFLRTPSAATPVRFLEAEQPDRWGAVGSPVGLVALLLALLGLLTRHPARWLAALLTGAGFVLSEGTLYGTVIRHVGVIATLLRIPSKLLLITLPFLGVLVGIGLVRLHTMFGSRRPVAAAALVVLGLTLAIPTGRILGREFTPRTSVTIPRPAEPTLTVYGPSTGDPANTHAVRARAGYILPWLCTEPFDQPPFTRRITQPTPIADVPAAIGPNRISLRVGAPPAETRILTRAAPGWRTNRGILVDEPDGAFRLLAPQVGKPNVTLQYRTATREAQMLIVGLFLVTVAVLLITLVPRASAAEEPQQS